MDGVGLASMTGHEVVAELKAAYAERAKVQARVLAAVWETALCDGDGRDSTERMENPDEWSVDEIRAALGLTRAAARNLLDTATGVMRRLPEIHRAMAAGKLDEPRARLLLDWTLELSDEHAFGVVANLLPRCELDADTRLTTGQLTEEIKRLAIALDPDWAQRRYEASLMDRKVVGKLNPEGTANLTGHQLPAERVAAACRRIDDLAKAAKRSGDQRRIDHLRANLFLGMTDGTYVGLTDVQILEHLAASDPDAPKPPVAEPAPDCGPETAAQPEEDEQPGWGLPSRAGVDLRVRVSTLLGLDRYPGELSGWGAIHSELACQLAHTNGSGQWRYTVTDTNGHVLFTGLTAARPQAMEKRVAHTKATVELLIPAELLDRIVGCRAPASRSDMDHRKDHAKGGLTTKENLAPVCRHDHRVKTEAGWDLTVLDTDFRWTTRLGHTYVVPAPPALPDLPDPTPGPSPSDIVQGSTDRDWRNRPWPRSEMWIEPPPEPPAELPPPPRPDPADEEPPF